MFESKAAFKFYNKHIAAALTLLHIKPLPSLLHDLSTNVDRALLYAAGEEPESLPPIQRFMTTERRDERLRDEELGITDEMDVCRFYSYITASFCTPLASTLALHPKASSISNWKSLLKWSHSNSGGICTGCGSGVMAGELRIMRTANDEQVVCERMILDTMDDSDRRIFEEMRDSGSNKPFGTWLMLNPFKLGSKEVMSAVPTLGKFSWETCREPRLSLSEPRGAQNVVKVGRDALSPPWNLNVSCIVHS